MREVDDEYTRIWSWWRGPHEHSIDLLFFRAENAVA